MGKIGKISSIKKEYNSQIQTMQSSLASKQLTRIPGTGVFKFPYKELDGKYRTGLDEKAAYIGRILDPVEKELEIKRVIELRDSIQEALGDVDLSPKSKFWNHAKAQSNDDTAHIQPMKLYDGENFFDFSDVSKRLAFAWLRVHPTIASSFQAWERGEYPADTQFFVADDELENAVAFNKKKAINRAIGKFEGMTPEKQRKVARLLGLPVTENTLESEVYNLVDDLLKVSEVKSGKYAGQNPIELFLRYADMKENLLTVKDLVKQALTHSIYRSKGPGGKIYEGDAEIAKDEDDLVKQLMDDDNQDQLLTLEDRLKHKKLAAI